jgi:hypothetical protein
MTVELVYLEGCPHAAAARDNLRRALRAAARLTIWREWELNDRAAPARVRTLPSPTVLVNGRDVTGSGTKETRTGGARPAVP